MGWTTLPSWYHGLIANLYTCIHINGVAIISAPFSSHGAIALSKITQLTFTLPRC